MTFQSSTKCTKSLFSDKENTNKYKTKASKKDAGLTTLCSM